MAASVADSLLDAAQAAKTSPISPSELLYRTAIPYSPAGRIASFALCGLFVLAVLGASLWLVLSVRPSSTAEEDSLEEVNARSRRTAWMWVVLVVGLLYCSHTVLEGIYGPLSAALEISSALHLVAFFLLWLGALQQLVKPLGDVGRTTTLMQNWTKGFLVCLLPLSAALVLVIFYNMLTTSAMGFLTVLENTISLIDEMESPIPEVEITSMQGNIESALELVFSSDVALTYCRLALVLVLIPLAGICEGVVHLRTRLRAKEAGASAQGRMTDTNGMKLLRLPSLISAASLRWSPHVQQCALPAQTWSNDAPAPGSAQHFADEEAGRPRHPVTRLLRAPSMLTVSSKYSFVTRIEEAPKMARPLSCQPSADILNEKALHSKRPASPETQKNRLIIISLYIGTALLYAAMELISALGGGANHLLPLSVVALTLFMSQGCAHIVSCTHRWGRRRSVI